MVVRPVHEVVREGTPRRPWFVANRATLPQKWPPPPRNVADSCELTEMTKPRQPSGFCGLRSPGRDLGDPVVHPPVGEQDRVVGAEDVVVRPVHEVVRQDSPVSIRARRPLPRLDSYLGLIDFCILTFGRCGGASGARSRESKSGGFRPSTRAPARERVLS